MSERPTVWVVKEQVKRGETGPAPMDYTPAYEFGDIEFITTFDPPVHKSSTLMTAWYEDIKKFLHRYNPDRDYLILTGSPLAIFTIGAIVGQIKSQYSVRVLVWRREQNKYVPTTIGE